MKLNLTKKDFLWVVAAISVVSVLQICSNANEIFSAPSVEDLNTFNGRVVNAWRNSKNDSFWIEASNDASKITVYVPKNCGCNLEAEVQIGKPIQIEYFRSSFISNMRAWSVRSNNRESVSYEKSVALHTGGAHAVFMVIFNIILISLIFAAMSLLLSTDFARKYIVKKK